MMMNGIATNGNVTHGQTPAPARPAGHERCRDCGNPAAYSHKAVVYPRCVDCMHRLSRLLTEAAELERRTMNLLAGYPTQVRCGVAGVATHEAGKLITLARTRLCQILDLDPASVG